MINKSWHGFLPKGVFFAPLNCGMKTAARFSPLRKLAVEEPGLRWIARLTGAQSLANRKGSGLQIKMECKGFAGVPAILPQIFTHNFLVVVV